MGPRVQGLAARSAAAAAAAIALALPTPGHPEAADAVPLPGYWETRNTWIFFFHFRTVERKCFTAADVSGVLQGPSNSHYACAYPFRTVGHGRLSLSGTCVETHGQVAEISAEGTYTATSFNLSAKLRTRIAGVPVHGAGTTEARLLAETCPVGAR